MAFDYPKFQEFLFSTPQSRSVSVKSAGSKVVTNCKGPHTLNNANVGSTRDLISQNKVCIKAKYCKADTT